MIKQTFPILVALLALGACSGPSERDSKAAKQIELTGNDQMKYNLNAFEVKAGEKVAVTMKNVGTMPKQSMGHNFILLDKNADVPKFVELGAANADNEYIPPAQAFRVLAKTKILGPGESETITFTAPRIQGAYPFICSFPGHYASGMKGEMTVTP